MKRGIVIWLGCVLLLCGCNVVGGGTDDLTAGESAGMASGFVQGTTPEPTAEATPEPTPEPTPELTPEPTPTPHPEVSVVMVGDVLLHTPVAKSGETEDGGYDFHALFENVREEISAADLALVNQEVIIGGTGLGISGYPAFNAPFELGDALADTGFDVILHATNHALDKGKRGILNCLEFWRTSHPELEILGIHDREEGSRDIYVYEQDGIRIAILNYTYGTNGIALPEGMPFAVDLLEEERVIADLQAAEELADFTIVCPHWGTEYTLNQTKAQERWAQLFAENGADLVIGTHPHVIEPVRWLTQDENGEWTQSASQPEDGQGTLIYYSLGNFANWTSGTGDGVANRMVGGMARVTLTENEDGSVRIRSWDVEPLVCHAGKGFGGVTVYPLALYNEELAAKNEIIGQDSHFSLEYCCDLVETVFGEAVETSWISD